MGFGTVDLNELQAHHLAKQNERLRANVSALAREHQQLQEALAALLTRHTELLQDIEGSEPVIGGTENRHPEVQQARKALEDTHYHGRTATTQDKAEG